MVGRGRGAVQGGGGRGMRGGRLQAREEEEEEEEGDTSMQVAVLQDEFQASVASLSVLFLSM